MSSKTFNGDDNLLFVINEKLVDFDELKDKGFDLMKIVSKQPWKGYFYMLNGPIYPNLVKEFWVNASIGQSGEDAQEIQSYVNGFPITITPSLIAQTIRCEEKGICVEQYIFNNVFSTLLFQIYANYNKLNSLATLLPIAKVWHQLLVSNIRPTEKELEVLTSDDKHLLCFLTYKLKVNLPLTIFNFLKEMIVTSRKEITFLVPYGRVLCELFSQVGIVKRVKRAGLTKALEVEWSKKFEYA